MNKYHDIVYQISGHVPFILMGIGAIGLAITEPNVAPAWFRIVTIMLSFFVIIVMSIYLYIALKRIGDDYY